MIERLEAKNGSTILKYDGRLLASQVDPIREARQWVVGLSILDRISNIVVIGAGCGYHLVELARRFAGRKIVVVDFANELVKFCGAEHSVELADVRFVSLDSASDISENSVLRKISAEGYALVRHTSSRVHHQAEFDLIEAVLAGRVPTGFQWILRDRPVLSEIFLRFGGSLWPREANAQPLTVKDLWDDICREKALSPSGQLVKAKLGILRELVN